MRRLILIPALASIALASACEQETPNHPSSTLENPEPETEPTALPDDRTVDYNLALRAASLKLLDTPPSLASIKSIELSQNPAVSYREAVDAMLADVRFRDRMVRWWKDTMRLGGEAEGGIPSRDTAPVFAAQIVVEERPFGDLFTASSGTCPTYDPVAHSFTPSDCSNGVPEHAGVLTNPGVQHQFFGNMAFRRVRWLQEVFLCAAFPVERASGLSESGYSSPWLLESISASPVDFRALGTVVCGNCHTTMNHIAPLFGRFDAQGMFHDTFQVLTPVAPAPVTTELSHWLSAGEETAWRKGIPAADLPSLGQAIAADPAVAACAVARTWNFAMSKDDIVSDQAVVPVEVIQPFINEFQSNGMRLKKVLRSILLSEDFIRF